MHEFEESTKVKGFEKDRRCGCAVSRYYLSGDAAMPKLVNMLNNLREQMYRYRVEYLKDERNYPTLMREHSEIVEGLMTKDKGRVTEAMHKHVKNQVVAVKEMIREQE